MIRAAGPWVVYLPGSRWDDVSGTDQQLARALAALRPVLWIDPPFSPVRALRAGGRRSARLGEVAPGVTRLQSYGVPGPSRPVLRRIAVRMGRSQVRRAARALGAPLAGVILASAQGAFPDLGGVPRMLFVTDDWVVGADLMGLSRAALSRQLAHNVGSADVVAAVSPDLAVRIESHARVAPGSLRVVPNGVTPLGSGSGVERESTALLLGQLNERLDLDVLEALVGGGIRLRVVGPKSARDPLVADRIERLLRRPEVTYVGRVPAEELAPELARCRVGVTPYLDTEFNRASFPLKTLEYLGAGLPVVSSDLPSVHWLDCPQVDIATSRDTFVAFVRARLAAPFSAADAADRMSFAERHSWHRRAEQVLDLLALA